MKNTYKVPCKFLYVLILLITALVSNEDLMAHTGSQRHAKREFFYLKNTGEWINYIEGKSYVEVVGTSFIGLQAAFNAKRTCLFGFFRPEAEAAQAVEIETRFVCFNTDSYELLQQKEWCTDSAPGCAGDPAGISIGIGNIEIVNPSLAAAPNEEAETFFNNYPQDIVVNVFKPLGSFSNEPEGLPHRYVKGKVLGRH
ncbi:MAG: hypothetical protein H7318_06300 [Oligoflexus sp.]|nr:hypothetical protein [Oligoflexus sp.]